MAYMITDGKPSITTVNNFLGLNMNETGDTQLQLGEASYMKNFRITKDYKLDKMYGYTRYRNPNARVRANWMGSLSGTEMDIVVAGGNVYKNGTPLGTLTDGVTTIFEFDQKLYFMNGTQFKYYDGTNFRSLVDNANIHYAYVPTIKISCTPEGVGEDYEPLNILTGYRKVSFSADGTSTVFQLPEKSVTFHAGCVSVNGVVQTEGVSTTGVQGKVTFTTAPAAGTNNVVITYTKGSSTASNITSNKYAQKFGLANDTRVFLYGNDSAKNRIYYSDLANGVPDPTYFPATNFIDVGSSNTAVTDISRQYDRLIVSKEEETYYLTYDAITDTSGKTIVTFPTYPLNTSHGMLAKAQGQVLDNFVTTIDNSGVIQWLSTNTKDERNADVISGRVKEWLESHDITKAVTLDFQEEKEYWIGIDNDVMIYNYANRTFYPLVLPDKVRTLTTYKGEVYMGTDTAVMRFQKSVGLYNGQVIDAEWRSGYYDFEAEYKRKTMRILWITMKPQATTYMSVDYISDRNMGTNPREISNHSISYESWRYDDFTYNTNNHVRPFKVKLKAKKFAFLKLVIKSNRSDYKLIVDSISIQKAYGGFVK